MDLQNIRQSLACCSTKLLFVYKHLNAEVKWSTVPDQAQVTIAAGRAAAFMTDVVM